MIWVIRPTAAQLERALRLTGASLEDLNRAHWNVWGMPGTDPARGVTRTLLRCLRARGEARRAA